MSITAPTFNQSKVGKDIEGAFFSERYSKDGSACLNGPQWSFDQYGRGPVSFNSLSDTCPGSTTFLVHRLAAEQEARPEYFARLNAFGISGYGSVDTTYDAQFGQQTQDRGYQLGLVNANQPVQTNNVIQNEVAPFQSLGTNVPVFSGPTF